MNFKRTFDHVSSKYRVLGEGCITLQKRRTRFFKTIGFLGIFYGIFLKTKEFGQRCTRFLQCDTPLGFRVSSTSKIEATVYIRCSPPEIDESISPTGFDG